MADMDFDFLSIVRRVSKLVDAGADFGGIMRIVDIFRKKKPTANPTSGSPTPGGGDPNPLPDIITTNVGGASDEQTLLYLESLCGVSKKPTATYVSPEERSVFGRFLSLLTTGEAATLMRGITRGGESEITVKVTETDPASTTPTATSTGGKKPATAKPKVTTKEYVIKATLRGIGIIKALAADILSGSDEAAQLAIATELVAHLRQAGVPKNSAATRAHLGKSAELIQKEVDTLGHEWRARVKLRFNSKRYAELMGTPVLVAKRAEIEAAKAADEHDACLRLHEEYQGLLIQETTALIERVIQESGGENHPPLAHWTTTDKILRIGGPVLIALFLLILAMN